MKKIIYVLLIIVVMNLWITEENKSELPSDTIRFRLIANSNSRVDQTTKLLIKKDLERNLFPLLEDSTSSEETKNILNNNPKGGIYHGKNNRNRFRNNKLLRSSI